MHPSLLETRTKLSKQVPRSQRHNHSDVITNKCQELLLRLPRSSPVCEAVKEQPGTLQGARSIEHAEENLILYFHIDGDRALRY